MVIEDRQSGEIQPMNAARLVTFSENHVRFTEQAPPPAGEADDSRAISMSSSTARLALVATQFLEQLPVLRKINPIQMPALSPKGELRLLPVGFDAATGILTAHRAPGYRLDLPIESARRELADLLSEFPFADRTYATAAQLAAMLTVYGVDLLSARCVLPAFAYTANNPGAGKGLLVALAVLPVHGGVPTAAPPTSETEMVKRLLATARAHAAVLFLDNVDELMQSRALESFITTSLVHGRLLGQTQAVTYPKQTVVFITGNQLQMRADMRRRCLVVDLVLTEARSEDRPINQPLNETNILSRRERILAALYALVRHWHDDGSRPSSRILPGLEEWSRTIAGIVEHAGYANPIPAPTAPTLDPMIADMESLVTVLAGRGTGVPFREVVQVCQTDGWFEDLVSPDRDLRDGERRKFSALLKRHDGMRFRGDITFVLQGRGHARRYLARCPATEPA